MPVGARKQSEQQTWPQPSCLENPIRASVVVMTFNRPGSLQQTLASLATQTLAPEDFEVVVVDVSKPSTPQVISPFVEHLQIRHIEAPNRGVAANRNLGASLAQGRVLAFLDDDCRVDSYWLAALVQIVEQNPSALAAAPVVHVNPPNAIIAAGQVITEVVDAFFNPPDLPPRFLPGLNFALDRSRFVAIGGCDSDFGFLAAEDRDFIDRWLHAGGRLERCPDCAVHHDHRSSLAGFIRQYFNYGRGAWRYHRLRHWRKHGRMWGDTRLHRELPVRLREPILRVQPCFRLQVLLLIVVWQLANLTGFLWQATLEGAPPRSRCGGS